MSDKGLQSILGKKIGMTQIFDSEGRAVPVTVIEAGPVSCYKKRLLKLMAMMQFSLVLILKRNPEPIAR